MMTKSLCCIMVVTAIWMLMVSAAPAASNVSPDSNLSPETSFVCGKPGIFADQGTGCQVFHFCQDDGRMDSFFCPNQTLFNQQFFVCDWFYNVDCSIADQFYHLNDALYLHTAEDTLSKAIEPAIKISQDEILTGSSSQVTSHTSPLSATSLLAKTQLDAGSNSQAIVVDGDLASLSASALPQTLVTNNNTDYYDPANPVLNDNYLDSSSDPEPAAYYKDPYSTGVNSGYSDPSSDPEPPASYTPVQTTSYSDSNVNTVYSDPYSDPEPVDPYSDPGPLYTSDPYSDPEPASFTPVLTTYSNPALNSVYSDPSTDPYTDPEPVYFSDPYTDPEPASYIPVLTSYANDPTTDPEPPSFYASNSDPYTDPEPPAYYDALLNNQVYDPEPSAAYQQPVVYSNSKLYEGDQYVLPTYQSSSLDPSDPEPSADPEYLPY